MAPRRTRLPRERHFSLDRCAVPSPLVVPGNWVAYFTMVGGEGRGRWLRCLVIEVKRHPVSRWYPNGAEVRVLDEEDDIAVLNRWEKVSTPPALKPKVLRSWLRAMAYYVPAQGSLV